MGVDVCNQLVRYNKFELPSRANLFVSAGASRLSRRGAWTAYGCLGFAWWSDGDNAWDSGRVLPMGVPMSGVLGLSGAVIGGFLPK